MSQDPARMVKRGQVAPYGIRSFFAKSHVQLEALRNHSGSRDRGELSLPVRGDNQSRRPTGSGDARDRRSLKGEEIVYIARATRRSKSNWRFARRFINNTHLTTTWMSFLSQCLQKLGKSMNMYNISMWDIVSYSIFQDPLALWDPSVVISTWFPASQNVIPGSVTNDRVM